MMNINKIPIPFLLARRPKDVRGYPIPFFQFIPPTYETDRKVDFRVTDPQKRDQCLRNRLCSLCGNPLHKAVYFIGGPLSLDNGIYSDPPMHMACAKYAMQACPFLYNKDYAAKSDPKSSEGFATVKDAFAVKGRPEKMYLIKAEGVEMVQVRDGNTGQTHPFIYAMAINGKIVETF